ncbi:MAG: LysM peptidoglycan-binding domain-containing protein [Chitinophagales bacterium]|nr:LysM peptidoglycan-binding domain-containing protein [Chitinophagales bacterium]
MKQLLSAFIILLAAGQLTAQEVTYVLFNRDCMNQLEYRYTYPNVKGDNSVWAYSIKPNIQEHFIFMTKGAGHYSPELPQGTISCSKLNLDDAFVANINREAQQMLIVFQRQSGGYWLMPVASATLVARNTSRYWVRSSQSSFQFDTLRLVNEQNLAVAGSPTAAYFSGLKLNNCLMEYSFHCEPVKASQFRSDIQFIPSVGIINDRTGNSASQAMENELQLVRVNGKELDDYLKEVCPEGTGKIAMSKYQKATSYGDTDYEADKELSSIMQKEQEAPVAHSTNAAGMQCAEEWEPGSHIVQKGENLRAIARTYKVSEQQLIKWNKIANPDRIEICQKIWLKPPPTSAVQGNSKGTTPQPAVAKKLTESGKTVTPQGISQGTKTKSVDTNKPVVYNDESAKDPLYEVEAPANATPRIHTVHRGEYLYKIAKLYGCPEECIRIANNMSLEGDEPLNIGQQLIIPECTCTLNGKQIKRPVPESPAAKPVVKPELPTVKKQDEVEKETPKPVKKTKVDLEDEAPMIYNYDKEDVAPQKTQKNNLAEDSSFYEDEASKVANKAKETVAPKKKTDGAAPKVPLFREHHVKQGETLKSIATKYRVDAAELSQVNGLDPKENLIPGKLILIPIDEE